MSSTSSTPGRSPGRFHDLKYSSQSTSALIHPDHEYVLADLSSFAYDPFLFGGVVYATVEHAFHAHKCRQAAHLFDSRNPLYIGDDPLVAKRTGGRKYFEQHGYTLRSDWDTFRVDLMGDLLNARTLQCPKSHNALKLTGDRQLVHAGFRIDKFWGVQRGGGANMHGKLLMQARALCTDLRKLPCSGEYAIKYSTVKQCLKLKPPRSRKVGAKQKRAYKEYAEWVESMKALLGEIKCEAATCAQRVWRGYVVRRDAARLKARQTRNLCLHVMYGTAGGAANGMSYEHARVVSVVRHSRLSKLLPAVHPQGAFDGASHPDVVAFRLAFRHAYWHAIRHAKVSPQTRGVGHLGGEQEARVAYSPQVYERKTCAS